MQDEPFSPLGCRIQGIGGRREVGYFCVAEWQLLIFSCGKWHVRWLKSGKQNKQNMVILKFSFTFFVPSY